MKKLLLGMALCLATIAPASAGTYVFSNGNRIAAPDGRDDFAAITVAGVVGPISKLTVTVNGLNAAIARSTALLLWNRTTDYGIWLMSDVGSQIPTVDTTLTFDDDAATQAPGTYWPGTYTISNVPLVSGTYKVSNMWPFAWPFTNPQTLAGFNGTAANGEWNLWMSDVFSDGRGATIDRGFSLSFTTATAGAVPEPATWAMMILGFAITGAALRARRTRVAFRIA